MTEFFDNSRHYIDIYNGDCVEVMDKLISLGADASKLKAVGIGKSYVLELVCFHLIVKKF